MTRLHRILLSCVERTITLHQMFQAGDRVVIAVSGGKDSFAAWRLLNDVRATILPDLELFPVYVDAGYGDSSSVIDSLNSFFADQGNELRVVEATFGRSIVQSGEKNPCFPCSRKRRELLFKTARDLNCHKVVFAHHRDDAIETVLLNMFFGREVATLLPVQPVFRNEYAIMRPLWYIDEWRIGIFAREQQFPVQKNLCPFDGHTRREMVRQVLRNLEQEHKGIRENLFAALFHINQGFLPSWPSPSFLRKEKGCLR